MQGDKDARSIHNVMRGFLPLVLAITSISITYAKIKLTIYLSIPREKAVT